MEADVVYENRMAGFAHNFLLPVFHPSHSLVNPNLAVGHADDSQDVSVCGGGGGVVAEFVWAGADQCCRVCVMVL